MNHKQLQDLKELIRSADSLESRATKLRQLIGFVSDVKNANDRSPEMWINIRTERGERFVSISDGGNCQHRIEYKATPQVIGQILDAVSQELKDQLKIVDDLFSKLGSTE